MPRRDYRHPLFEGGVLDTVLFLRIISERMEWFGRVLIDMETMRYLFLSGDSNAAEIYQQCEQRAGIIISEMRQAAYGYYQVWMLRHMLRISIWIVFGFDLFKPIAVRRFDIDRSKANEHQ